MNIQFSQLNSKAKQIYNILTNRVLYEKPILDEHIFNSDLVIKMKFPLDKQHKYMNKSQYIPLNQFIYNPSQDLNSAHRIAYQYLITENTFETEFDQDLESQKIQNLQNIKIKKQINFQNITQQKEIIENRYQVLLGNGRNSQITFPCYVKCKSTLIDAFALNYNALIYIIQKKCGFQTQTVIVEQKQGYFAYILLNQTSTNLLKAADKFRIKKQVDYCQLDLFLNQPTDSLGRPYQNSSSIMENKKVQKQILKSINSKINQNQERRKSQLNEFQITLNKRVQQKQKQKQRIRAQRQRVKQQKQKDRKIIQKINKDKQKQKKLKKQENQKMLKEKQKSKNQQLIKQTTKNIKNMKQLNQIRKSNVSNVSKVNVNTQQDIQQLQKQKSQSQQFINLNQLRQLYKRVHRNMKNKNYKVSDQIIDQKQLNPRQISAIKQYLTQFFSQFDKILKEQLSLSSQQKNYIYKINRRKTNTKCENQYIVKLKRKKLYQLIAFLSKKYHYQVHDTPLSFFPFILPSKKLSFMQRLRGVLFYKQYQVTPYGDLSLFSKMDRIKIAYLTLKQYVRVDNINKINCQIFALHDDFQRIGLVNEAIVQRKILPQIKGGVDGQNVTDNWSPFTPWNTNITLLRNYFGEDTVYQIYIKNHLILYFMIISFLGIIGQVVSRLFVYYNSHYNQYLQRGFSSTHKQELIFHLVYFALSIGLFSYFLQSWLHKEKQYKQNFVQNQSNFTFRYQFKGPYVRNIITDSVNQHEISLSFKSQVIRFLAFILILIILGGQCGYFHGMRMSIVKLSTMLPKTNVYLISWPHVLCYGIFYLSNIVFYLLIITKITKKMTNFQNLPTQKMHIESIDRKNFLFLIGLEMIPVIFLLVFEPFGGNSCYASSCYDQFTQYIYSRYVIVFLHIGYKILSFILKYIKSDLYKQKDTNKYELVDFDTKMDHYLKFIQKQSKKQYYQPSIDDQTLTLLHYGIFVTSFPLSPLLGVGAMILEYLIQRIQLLDQNKRPICKSQTMQNYSDNYQLIMHLSIFINSWIIFYTLEQVEYTFQRFIRTFISQNPTFDAILILKIIIIIIVILFFEIYVSIIRYFAKSSSNNILNNRKRIKYEKYLINKNFVGKNKSKFQFDKIHPFRTIFRTYHKQVAEKAKKSNKLMTQFQESSQDQYSSTLLKRKRN